MQFFRTAAVMLVLGMCLGLYMAIRQDFTLMPVHAHINVVGGLLIFLIGLYYRAHPEAARGPLPKLQYWLFLAGILTMALSLGMLLSNGDPVWGPVIGASGILLLLAMLLFAVSVFRTRTPVQV